MKKYYFNTSDINSEQYVKNVIYGTNCSRDKLIYKSTGPVFWQIIRSKAEAKSTHRIGCGWDRLGFSLSLGFDFEKSGWTGRSGIFPRTSLSVPSSRIESECGLNKSGINQIDNSKTRLEIKKPKEVNSADSSQRCHISY